MNAQIAPLLAPPMAAVVAVVRQLDRPAVRAVFCLDLGQQFFEQEPGVVVAQAVVFVAAVEAVEGLVVAAALTAPGRDEDADRRPAFPSCGSARRRPAGALYWMPS